MSRSRRCTAALVGVLVALTTAGCTAGWPPPSCGEYTLGRSEGIPREAVDCMADAGKDGVLTVTVYTAEGHPIVTVYRPAVGGGIAMDVDSSQDPSQGVVSLFLCPHAVSV